MTNITVDFRQNNIFIDDKEISINDFKYFVKDNNGFTIEEINNNNNDNIQKFIEAQQYLRTLDMMKDGSVSSGRNISGSVSGITGYSQIQSYKDNLLNIEKLFSNFVEEKIEKLEWTKISNSNTKKIDIDFSFQESGLNSFYFIDNINLKYVINFANEVLDPASRTLNQNSINFPEINKTIKFTNGFLNFFGFINTKIESKKINNTPKYEFIINIGSNQNSPITDRTKSNYFIGNVEKNNWISSNNGKKPIKNALLVCKELGDVLQVLFMLIWKHSNPVRSYCISTCDKVVALFCIMLNLNYTLAVVDKTQQPKLKYIEYYNYDINGEITIAKKNENKFKKEKELIKKNNTEIIKSIEILQNKNPPIGLSVSGISIPVTFPAIFYENILTDSKYIQDKLEEFNLTDFESRTIQKEIIDMKKNFTLIRLIVKNKNNTYKLCLFKKYTLKDNLYKDFNSKFDNYGSTSFYNIGLKMKSGGTGGATIDDKMEVDNENEETTNEDENEILKILEFPDGKAYFYYIDDETGNEFKYNNLYDILKEDIDKILFKFSSRKYFDDIYNILLYYFYFENEVFHGEKLEFLIETITNEIFDEETIQEIKNKKNEVENQKKELEKNTRDIFENTNKISQSVGSNFQYFSSLPKNFSKISSNPYDSSSINKKRSAEYNDLSLDNKSQKVGGFKKNKTNKKKQIKKKNKETKKKNKKTKKTKKNIRIFYTSLAKKNKQTKKTYEL